MHKSAEQYVEDAMKQYNACRYEVALENCTKAIQIDHACARAYHGRGLIYARQKKYTDAYNDYQKSYQLIPNNAKLLIDIGSLFCSLNNYKEAGRYYRQAIELDKKYRTAYTSRITNMIEDAFRVDHSYYPSYRKKAIDILKQVVLFDPDNEKAKYYLSCWQIALKNKPSTKVEPEPAPEPSTSPTWIDSTPLGPASIHPHSCRCYKCIDSGWLDEDTFTY